MAKNYKITKRKKKNDSKIEKNEKKQFVFVQKKNLEIWTKKTKRSKENLPSWRNLKFQACSKLFNLQKWKGGGGEYYLTLINNKVQCKEAGNETTKGEGVTTIP